MYIRNGNPIALTTGMVIDDVQIVMPLSAERLAELGITEVPDPVRPDDRFYWVSQMDDGTFESTPKDLALLKSGMVGQVKETAGLLLAQTDWKVTRKFERGIEIDAETAEFRASVVAAATENEVEINAAVTVEALAEMSLVWPKQVQ